MADNWKNLGSLQSRDSHLADDYFATELLDLLEAIRGLVRTSQNQIREGQETGVTFNSATAGVYGPETCRFSSLSDVSCGKCESETVESECDSWPGSFAI